MSNSLVLKSLELLGCEKNLKQEKKRKKKIQYKGTLDLIPAKHRTISKDDKRDLGTILGRSSKISVYEAKKQIATKQDPTEDNVKRLLSLSNNLIDSETADKLVNRALKIRKIVKKEKPKEPEKTAFTEKDFEKFEQEYVN